jgi:hypothetical protein
MKILECPFCLWPKLLGSHHRIIVVTQVGQGALITVWAFVDADTLTVPQQSFMKVVDGARIQRQQGL